MMRFPQTLRRRIADFGKDEKGSAAVELVAFVPLFSVITLGLISYFSAFKAETQATRAAIVVADMVSRETNPITPTYLSGVDGLLNTLVRSDDNPEYRLTAFRWNDRNQQYRVRWSKKNGDMPTMTSTALNAVADSLPDMTHNQRAILLETWVDYEPYTNVGLEDDTVFTNFLVTTPRFVPQLCFLEEGQDPSQARC